jgi:hypothetical protein
VEDNSLSGWSRRKKEDAGREESNEGGGDTSTHRKVHNLDSILRFLKVNPDVDEGVFLGEDTKEICSKEPRPKRAVGVGMRNGERDHTVVAKIQYNCQ